MNSFQESLSFCIITFILNKRQQINYLFGVFKLKSKNPFTSWWNWKWVEMSAQIFSSRIHSANNKCQAAVFIAPSMKANRRHKCRPISTSKSHRWAEVFLQVCRGGRCQTEHFTVHLLTYPDVLGHIANRQQCCFWTKVSFLQLLQIWRTGSYNWINVWTSAIQNNLPVDLLDFRSYFYGNRKKKLSSITVNTTSLTFCVYRTWQHGSRDVSLHSRIQFPDWAG